MPNSLSMLHMSKPTPLSLTQKTLSSSASNPYNCTRGRGLVPLYLSAFEIKLTCLTQQRVVAPCLRQGAYRNFRVRAAICQGQVGADLCHQSPRIEARSLDRLIPYSRQSQQSLYNVSRFSYGVPDDADLPSPLVTQFGAMILFEHAGEAVKRPQRRPQVV